MFKDWTVQARSFVRKMRGGAQSHLLQADDENFYVVKFRNNPQHRRILINELLSSAILKSLGILSPKAVLVGITPEFLRMNPEVHLTVGGRHLPVETGWHFGSQYPGNPASTAVYDFLPKEIRRQVVNSDDFLAALLFDKWVANMDGRQCVFYRAAIQSEGYDRERVGWVASMIDHGFAFNGPRWDFPESAIQGLCRNQFYGGVRSLDDFQPWLDQILHFPERMINHARKSVPAEWIEHDEEALERMLDRLFQRRKLVPALVKQCCNASPDSFPLWSAPLVYGRNMSIKR
jgi:hypothetical protein